MKLKGMDFQKILELEKQLREIKDEPAIQVELVEGLLNGRKNTSAWKKRYQMFCERTALPGVCLTEEDTSDDILLSHILDACDPEMLSALAERYSASPHFMKMIRERCRQSGQMKLDQELKKPKATFYQLLVKEMKKRGYDRDSDYYNYLGFSRQTFSKIRKADSKISKENALLLTLGLTPDYQSGMGLLNEAGYSLRKSNRREYIILYVMQKGPYTLFELNELLIFFGEKPIGCEA